MGSIPISTSIVLWLIVTIYRGVVNKVITMVWKTIGSGSLPDCPTMELKTNVISYVDIFMSFGYIIFR